MSDKNSPVPAPTWNRRTISTIRRELERSFEALKVAHALAQRERTAARETEAAKAANSFMDLFDLRWAEYNKNTIEEDDGAQEAADKLVTDFQRYKEALQSHYATGGEIVDKSAEKPVSGSCPVDPPGDEDATSPRSDVSKSSNVRYIDEMYKLTMTMDAESSIFEKETRGGESAPKNADVRPKAAKTNTNAKKPAPSSSSFIASMRKKMGSTVMAGKRALDTIVTGQSNTENAPSLPPPSTHLPPPLPPPPPPPPPPVVETHQPETHSDPVAVAKAADGQSKPDADDAAAKDQTVPPATDKVDAPP